MLRGLRVLGSWTNAATERVKLMSLDYRIAHFLTIISIFALLVTGPSERSAANSVFHIDFGLLWGGVLIAYSLYLVVRHRVRMFDALKSPVTSQIKDGFAILQHYTLGTPFPSETEQRMGRYNILATYASLVLVLSFIPLTVGGVWMIFLQRGTAMYETMKLLHLMGVGLIALFFLVHLFAVIQAEHRPLLKAVFTSGKVSLEWARKHLGEYASKIHEH